MSQAWADIFVLSLWLAWNTLLGASFVSMFWPRRVTPHRPVAWLASMSLAAGLAFASIGHLLWIVAGPTHGYMGGIVGPGLGPWIADLAIAAILLPAGVVCWFLRRRRRSASEQGPRLVAPPHDPGAVLPWRLAAFASVVAMVVGATLRLIESPHGEFDAISIWNARARFFFRWPEHWRDAFASAVHADYPLMLPLNVARSWWAVGHETLLSPAMLSVLFALMTLAALWGSVRLLAGTRRACVSVLMLTAAPLLAVQASFEYADIPLACCVASAAGLASLSLRLVRSDGRDACDSPEALGLLALAGLCCGAAAWLKNEGQLVTVAATLATFAIHPAAFRASILSRFKRLAVFLAGAAAPLLVVLIVRRSIGHPNDLLGDRSLGQIVQLLADPERHFTLWSEFFMCLGDLPDELRTTGLFMIIGTSLFNMLGLLCVPAFVAVTWPRGATVLAPASRWVLTVVTLVAAGYYVIYLLTPYEIGWHVKFSVTRLFMHLWPAAVLLLATAGPMATAPKPAREPLR